MQGPAGPVHVESPATIEGRREAARSLVHAQGLTIPLLVDGMDDAAARAFDAMLPRLFLLAGDGSVLWRSEREGPRFFDVGALEEALERQLE